MLRDRGGVARAMQDADDNDLRLAANVIDGVIALKRHAQTARQAIARRPRHREVQQASACRPDLVEERGRGGLRILGDESPDFGQVGFRRIGQTERERLANSFLPRAMMLSASKSFTRPAATSDRPLSMSAFKAASS